MLVELNTKTKDLIVRHAHHFGWSVPVKFGDDEQKIVVHDGFLGVVTSDDPASVVKVFSTIAAKAKEQIDQGVPLKDVQIPAGDE